MKANPLRLCLPGIVLLLAFNGSAQSIIQIASSGDESLFVKSDGSLWKGDFGHQLAQMRQGKVGNRGLFDTLENREPYELIVSNGVRVVAMNLQHDAFFIRDNGSLWAMGDNEGGCLGDGTFTTPNHPIQIVSSGVSAVACGEVFTLFLKDDGSLWGFGFNGSGELGDGENNFFLRPKQIVASGVVAIAAGYLHTLFLKNDGSLWGLGNNAYGQLGIGTNHESLQPVQIASRVVSVAAGAHHTLFIKSDGCLWAMGLNGWGQIGDCTIKWAYRPKLIVSNDVVAVTAGYEGSLFLKKDGSLWAMGINWHTDYGEGIEFDSKCPMQIMAASQAALVAGYYYNAKLKSCASIWACSFNQNALPKNGAGRSEAGLRSDVVSLPGYNLITIEMLKDGNVRLTYQGDAGVKYALERSSNLTTPHWLPLVTNTPSGGGVLVITNPPDTTMDNFWRIRSVP